MKRIIVGVDGSEGSKAALRWAHEEARRWGASLEAVHAWHLPAGVNVSGTATAAQMAPYWRSARDLLSSTIGAVIGEGGRSTGVPVLQTVFEGPAESSLLIAAAGADLLVLGSRGLGRVGGPLLGSVSQHCMRHAPCTVVVIPHESCLTAA